MTPSAALNTVADVYLETLRSRGIDFLLGNGGTDFAPLIEAYARSAETGRPAPEPVTVPHETVAVAMAHGHAMVTGRIETAVMVHTIAGTANSVGGLINARRSRVPLLLTAGRTPLTEGGRVGARNSLVNWSQESYDQAAMVREWVKWDYELRSGVDVGSVVDRSLAIARSEPEGPVYLTLPREVLAEEIAPADADGGGRQAATRSGARSGDVAEAARRLVSAQNPIAVVRSSGRDPRAVAPLVRLAEVLGIPVFDPLPTHVNMPWSHPLLMRSDPAPHLGDADVIVVVESDVPWVPERSRPRADAVVVSVGPDPLYSDYPVRGFPVDLSLAGGTCESLGALVAALEDEGLDARVVEERTQRWTAVGREVTTSARERALGDGEGSRLTKQWLSHCFEQLRTPDMVVVNEIGFDAALLGCAEPGSYFGLSPAGVLGWGLGAALGAKLAAPERPVVACVGDGSYMFGAPSAAHWVSRRYDLPVLFVVWNNARWFQVEAAARSVFPGGDAVRSGCFPFSDLSPSVDFERICEAAGGHGERVETTADVPAALERAMESVRNGRQALVNVAADGPPRT